MLWIIIGITAVAVFTVCAALLISDSRKKPVSVGESRPGFQEVIIHNAVDVSTQQYVYRKGSYFPNVDGMQSTPTVVTEECYDSWNIVFTDLSSGKKYRKTFARQLILGRDPAARSGESRMLIADNLVSKTHCVIRSRNNSLAVSDAGSRNGTFVNGARIFEETPLNSGDKLEIGRTSMEIQIFRDN